MTGSRPQFRDEHESENLRRIASLTPSLREVRKRELKKRQEALRLKIENEKQNAFDGWDSLSLRRKKKRSASPSCDTPPVHHLPRYEYFNPFLD